MATAKKSTPKEEKKNQQTEKKGILDLIRTPYLIGLGAFSVTTEEVEKLIDRLIKEGEASEKEGKKLFEELNKKLSQSRQDLQDWIEKQVKETLKKVKLEDQVKELTNLVKDLSKKVERIIKKETPTQSAEEIKIE